jgi:aryl-alcohol dehydrogenase-like predicted oxidoreductase
MNKRNLGGSGLEITTLGFGSWATGGGGWAFGWGPQDDDASVAAIRHAVGQGVNWVDTAGVYGLGHAEEVVGRAIRDIPAAERPLVFTKGGLTWDPANPSLPARRISHPDSLRRDIEASLRRLDVERIDLFQIHWPDESGVPLEDSWGEMARFVQEGKARAIGVSNYDVARLERIDKVHHVDSLQPPLSLINRGSARDVIPWARAHGTGVIVYSPMASGILTDSFGPARVAAMADDDWRKRSTNFTEPELSKNVALRDVLVPIAKRHGATVSAVALAWAVAWPGVTGAIVGARSPEQVDGWIGAASFELTLQDRREIEAAVAATGAGNGPVEP